jgi:hypothetical protein
MNSKAVFGIVPNQPAAHRLIDALRSGGFSQGDISVLFPNEGTTRDFAHAEGTKAPEGAVVGGGVGGAIGGTLGLLAGLGALAIPGIGPLIAAGPIFAALSGVAVGAAVGSVAGGLAGLGVPEIQAKLYEGKLREGNIIVSAHTKDGTRVDAAKRIFEQHGATHVSVTREATVPKDQAVAPSVR